MHINMYCLSLSKGVKLLAKGVKLLHIAADLSLPLHWWCH